MSAFKLPDTSQSQLISTAELGKVRISGEILLG